jgi:hypothetical protein
MIATKFFVCVYVHSKLREMYALNNAITLDGVFKSYLPRVYSLV